MGNNRLNVLFKNDIYTVLKINKNLSVDKFL